MHVLFVGILLGMGAAVPVGPVNLEIIRRNLRFGTPYGMVTGIGACGADVTYLILLCLGALALLQYPDVLRTLSGVGSLILAWFAIQAFRAKKFDLSNPIATPSLWRYGIEGYVITLINPYTILFWASISSQVATLTAPNGLLLSGLGVVIGTVGWVLILNISLHFTRHKLSHTAIKLLNHSGGIILMCFAGLGMWRAVTGRM